MFDSIVHTPIILAYVFMSLPVLILIFLLINVVHKIYRTSRTATSSSSTSPPTLDKSSLPFQLKQDGGNFLKQNLTAVNLQLIETNLKRSKAG